MQEPRLVLRGRATTETKRGPFGAAPAKRVGSPAVRRLVHGVKRRMPWLAAVPAGRLVPLLTRFARAGWTERDVERA